MIVNECAIAGVQQILSKFPDHEVLSLCATVTQGLLKNKIQSRQAAIDAILKYSPDSSSFLRRKLLTRNHLFEYLDESGIKVELPITKEELIFTIAHAWDKKKTKSKFTPKENNENTKIEERSTTNDNQVSLHEQHNNIVSIQPEISSTSSTSSTSIVNQQNDLTSNIVSKTELELMSVQFCEWFYTLMNKNEVIASDHFYPDASLQIRLVSNAVSEVEEVLHNGEDVCQLLFKVKSQHGLFFNPNLTKDGTRGKTDPHGLVMIMCCGTLHINNVISGVFEQLFALARDPTSLNNWKVKNSQLVLRSQGGVTSMPCLGTGILEITES